jgi:hypothetical protein
MVPDAHDHDREVREAPRSRQFVMDFKLILQGLRIDIVKHAKLYPAARERHAALAPYPTTRELLGAMDRTDRTSAPDRDAITLALVAEQQVAPHPFWTALLLHAYRPMIQNLVRNAQGDPEELGQRALLGALEVFNRLPVNEPPALVALSIRRAVAERVYDRLAIERRETADTLEFSEHKPARTAEFFAAEERMEELLEVARVVKAEAGPLAALDMLVATVGHDEKLQGYVERTRPGRTRTESRRAYMRTRADRARLVAKIRSRLGCSEETTKEVAKETVRLTPLCEWGRKVA